MREHLYRAKRKDNGEWVYGSLISLTQGEFIVFTDHYNTVNIDLHEKLLCNALWEDNDFDEVNPETICEYTGLTDKNGNKIFERDILKAHHNDYPYLVSYEECRFKIEDKWGNRIKMTQDAINWFEVEVIGNIFDNPELLNDKK